MAFTGSVLTTSFKTELLKGCHDFTASTGDAFKIAMYTNNASFTANTTVYTAADEVSSSGYTAGGAALSNSTPVNSGTTAFTDFSDVLFTAVTLTAWGALIYNTTPNTTSSAGLTNPCVAVLDFGSAKTATAGDFAIVFPAANASTAIIRIA